MDDTTIINVKGVRKASWNAATRAASLGKEPYGPWLSDAIDQRLYREARGQETEAPAMTPDQITARISALAELAKGIGALKAAGHRAVGIGSLSQGLAVALAEDMRRLGLARRGFGKGSVKPEAVLLESEDGCLDDSPATRLEQSMP